MVTIAYLSIFFAGIFSATMDVDDEEAFDMAKFKEFKVLNFLFCLHLVLSESTVRDWKIIVFFYLFMSLEATQEKVRRAGIGDRAFQTLET